MAQTAATGHLHNGPEAKFSELPPPGHVLYGIAQSCALAGDTPRAVQAYKDSLAEWQHADGDLPQVKEAKSWLAAHGQ